MIKKIKKHYWHNESYYSQRKLIFFALGNEVKPDIQNMLEKSEDNKESDPSQKKIESLNKLIDDKVAKSNDEKLKQDINNFILQAIKNAGLKDYNAGGFDQDNEAGLDNEEFEKFKEKLNRGIDLILDIGSIEEFTNTYESKVGSEEASLSNLTGTKEGESIGKNLMEKAASLCNVSVEEIKNNMDEYKNATITDPKKFAAGLILSTGEFGTEIVEESIKFAYDAGRCAVDLPLYLKQVADVNFNPFSDKKEDAISRIEAKKLIDQNSALSLIALLGDAGFAVTGMNLSMDGEENRASELTEEMKNALKSISLNPFNWKAGNVAPALLMVLPLLRGNIKGVKKGMKAIKDSGKKITKEVADDTKKVSLEKPKSTSNATEVKEPTPKKNITERKEPTPEKTAEKTVSEPSKDSSTPAENISVKSDIPIEKQLNNLKPGDVIVHPDGSRSTVLKTSKGEVKVRTEKTQKNGPPIHEEKIITREHLELNKNSLKIESKITRKEMLLNSIKEMPANIKEQLIKAKTELSESIKKITDKSGNIINLEAFKALKISEKYPLLASYAEKLVKTVGNNKNIITAGMLAGMILYPSESEEQEVNGSNEQSENEKLIDIDNITSDLLREKLTAIDLDDVKKNYEFNKDVSWKEISQLLADDLGVKLNSSNEADLIKFGKKIQVIVASKESDGKIGVKTMTDIAKFLNKQP